jgi:cytochrome c oxidase cbb3-type subunit 3
MSPGWKTWSAVGVAIALAAASIAYSAQQADLRARLMRADPDAIPDDPELTRFASAYARSAYDDNCAACHGARMQGDRRNGVPDLTDQDWLYGEGRVTQIEHTILYGIRAHNGKTLNFADMPGFARPSPYRRYQMDPLEPDEIRDAVTFLLGATGRGGDAAAAKRGAEIFSGKGQCFDCHSGDAKGDTAIGAPNLLDDIWLYGDGSYDDIYAEIARGSSGVCPAWYDKLSAVTIRALAVLVYTVSHQAPPRAADPPGMPAGTKG